MIADLAQTATGRLQDVEAIRQATFLHVLGLDRRDPSIAIEAFTDDAVWDATCFGLGRIVGRAALLEFFERDAAAVAEQYHCVTNHIVELDGPDRAHGTCYVISEGRTRGGSEMRAAMLNEDTYRKDGKAWRIATRIVTLLTSPESGGLSEF